MKIGADAKPRLRIALLVDRFGRRFGGAEAYGVELMRVLAERHEVTVVARAYDSDLMLPYLPVRPIRGLPSWLRVLYFAWRAWRLTRGDRFDIVHSHMNGWAGQVQVMHVTPVRYGRLHAKGWVQRLCAWANPRLGTYLWLERARLRPRLGRRVVAVSQLIVEQIHAAYSPTLPLTTILPGVDRAPARDEARRRATRVSLGVQPSHIVCLLVARNPLRKGLPTLMEALAYLPAVYRLVVVGTDHATRQALALRADLAQRICLIEPTPGVSRYYEAADIYVHPTLNDSFGMAPLEAMAHGLPIVISAAKYCGFAQYLTDGQNASILMDPRDPVALAQTIHTLGQDSTRRLRLIEGGYTLARRQSWHAVADRYEALYADILQEQGRMASN